MAIETRLTSYIPKVIRHNPAIAIALAIGVVLVVWIYGCQSSTQSLLVADKKVSAMVFAGEVETLLSRAEIGFHDLERQDKIKQLLLEQALLFAEGNTINPVGAITTALGVLGIGAVVDNRRKDKVIRDKLRGLLNGGDTS